MATVWMPSKSWKAATGGEKGDGAFDDDGVVGVHQSDVARKDEKDDAHARHESTGAKKNGGVSSECSADRIFAAEGLADADGGSGGDAERNHEGEGDGVERDLMAGEWDGAETRDECGDESEDADFHGDLHGGGNAESEEMANALKIEFNGSFEEVGVVPMVVPEEIDD